MNQLEQELDDLAPPASDIVMYGWLPRRPAIRNHPVWYRHERVTLDEMVPSVTNGREADSSGSDTKGIDHSVHVDEKPSSKTRIAHRRLRHGPRRACPQCGHMDSPGSALGRGGGHSCRYQCPQCHLGPLVCNCRKSLETHTNAGTLRQRKRRTCKQCGRHADQCRGAKTIKGGSDHCQYKCLECGKGPLKCPCDAYQGPVQKKKARTSTKPLATKSPNVAARSKQTRG